MTLLGWFLVAVFTAEFWWAIAAALIVTVTVVLVRRAVQRHNSKAAALVRRCDEQHRQVLKDDPRGTYGKHWPADPYPTEPDAEVPPGFAKRMRIAKRPPMEAAENDESDIRLTITIR